MFDNVGKNNELRDAADGCMTEAEKKILGITPDLEPERLFRENVERVMQEDSATINVQHVPLSKARSVDRKDLYPYQGKESDGEIMFSFESLVDAQDLYDFMLETQLVTPGEIKLKVHESGAHAQYSVHFTANVLVQKPDVIQAAMIAYQDQLAEGDEEAYEDLAQDVDAVLTEREKSYRGSAEPKKYSTATGRGVGFNPFHGKDGVFTSREGLSDGGSWSDGKKVRLKATKKGAKLHFAGTKRPCGREARGKGKDIRCWDGKPGLGFEVAQSMKAMAKKKRSGPREMPNFKKEDFDRASMAAIQECWDLYGIPMMFESLDEGGCQNGEKMVFGKCVKQHGPSMDSLKNRYAKQREGIKAYRAGSQRVAARAAAKTEGMAALLSTIEEATESPKWKKGDPVPDGYIVVFGKLAKGDGRKAKASEPKGKGGSPEEKLGLSSFDDASEKDGAKYFDISKEEKLLKSLKGKDAAADVNSTMRKMFGWFKKNLKKIRSDEFDETDAEKEKNNLVYDRIGALADRTGADFEDLFDIWLDTQGKITEK